MTRSLDQLRRAARRLQKAHAAGDADALHRLRLHPPRADGRALKLADFLHVVAQENGFESWPKLKFAADLRGFDRAAKEQRLKVALYHGQNWVVERLLADTPDLAQGHFGLLVALLDRPAVEAWLARDPGAAVALFGPRRPILHLAFSRHIHSHPEREADMLAIAEMLLAHGADVNDGYPYQPGDDHLLSALYGALGHADNLPLARWLLAEGANPNDNESLYHSTELPHADGVKLLLAHGARPEGTNALLRAMDFNSHEKVRILLEAGADPNEGVQPHPSGEATGHVGALHQAARRNCDAEMARLLLAYGADLDARWEGRTAYACARIYGNQPVAEALAAAGADTALSPEDAAIAQALEGRAKGPVPAAAGSVLLELLHAPEHVPLAKRLVDAGAPLDVTDAMGLPPVQIAGWEGLPEAVSWLLAQSPDLAAEMRRMNRYGGDLLSTIIHGSENCPARAARDHVACARLVLEAGAMLPRRAPEFAGEPEMAAFLATWAEEHPEQVSEGGVV
ncbi:ankyrin repeat domain-containing protein [Pseudoruegeria sp. SHC-113]|uniref:ankyrin repeat domain-containing protein n=1 Tax=Pseudoruegeria sp. SHC-113 TaxID=2855439 RepID=UPI0021BAA465|nr:ankyrin repeat domain-containing protein [Pseudoruegeria sp. SHC-113]MCT8161536.1 ankyrin repeat domain-containing protein [Pseudoruegeria sp. SHC-113]